MKPMRIQLSRKKGWKLPPNTVVVSRPSKWGNPFTIALAAKLHPFDQKRILRARCVAAFSSYASDTIPQIIAELRGKNLACWCPLDEPCHADVLLKIANP